jgi:hypothetical protein
MRSKQDDKPGFVLILSPGVPDIARAIACAYSSSVDARNPTICHNGTIIRITVWIAIQKKANQGLSGYMYTCIGNQLTRSVHAAVRFAT